MLRKLIDNIGSMSYHKIVKVGSLALFQAIMIRIAFESRGVFAIGGEYLVLPLIWGLKQVKTAITELLTVREG